MAKNYCHSSLHEMMSIFPPLQCGLFDQQNDNCNGRNSCEEMCSSASISLKMLADLAIMLWSSHSKLLMNDSIKCKYMRMLDHPAQLASPLAVQEARELASQSRSHPNNNFCNSQYLLIHSKHLINFNCLVSLMQNAWVQKHFRF